MRGKRRDKQQGTGDQVDREFGLNPPALLQIRINPDVPVLGALKLDRQDIERVNMSRYGAARRRGEEHSNLINGDAQMVLDRKKQFHQGIGRPQNTVETSDLQRTSPASVREGHLCGRGPTRHSLARLSAENLCVRVIAYLCHPEMEGFKIPGMGHIQKVPRVKHRVSGEMVREFQLIEPRAEHLMRRISIQTQSFGAPRTRQGSAVFHAEAGNTST